ncbi:MAG TPA: Uma2 family endonuclease [Bryobacteraceae bacterium]|nr:Uma2 family endonuclease [Bryobacteraceae bacterium]
MKTGELIGVRENLSTSYGPDRDYVDGVVEERSVGEKDHTKLQRQLLVYYGKRAEKWGIQVFPGRRIQVSPTRFRVPDVCVTAGPEPAEQVFYTPPFMGVEILSPEDRRSRVRERSDDYLPFGVPHAFLLDPEIRKAYRWTTAGMTEVSDLPTENPDIFVLLEALFE